MNEKLLARLDRVSVLLLLLWTGMALGIAVLAAPSAFKLLPSRDLAGQVVGACFRWIDLLAWFAFGGPFLLSFGSRWLAELKDQGIGPMQLWSAAALAALLMCFTSTAIVSPKLENLRSRFNGPVESLPASSPDRAAFNRAHSISEQLLGLRMLLALGLALGLSWLPRQMATDTEQE